jgi:glutamate/tyrosine decarboxylase-like PLP-dependent enzyme
MFELNNEFASAVFDYCRTRLHMEPPPLDFGSLRPISASTFDDFFTANGRDPHEVLSLFVNDLALSIVSTDSPEFLAFIPNAPTKNSLLFDMVVACSGLNGTSYLEAAGAVEAENATLRFLASQAGLPSGAGGVFVSGGSMGNLSALTVARDEGRRRNPHLDPRDIRIAISADAHSSVGQSLHVIGVEPFVVPVDDHRFTAEALRRALANDPFAANVVAVVATAGTTNAGIIDDLEGLGSFARENNWWFHVDGAYGGAGIFSPTHRDRFRGLRHADSFIVDPHKWLFGPLDCCALLWRDPLRARDHLAQRAGYLDILHEDNDGATDWNPADFALHLSRRARGLPFWFSLAVHGTQAYEAAVQRAIDLATWTASVIQETEHLELIREPELSIVLFRRKGWTPAQYSQWSHQLLRDQIAMVTPTVWEGETVGRIAFLHPDTSHDVVRAIVDSLRD